MSIAIYSRNLKHDLRFDRFKYLIVNSIIQGLPPGSLTVFSPEKAPDLSVFQQPVPLVPLAAAVPGLLAASVEKGWALPRLLKKNNIQSLLLLNIRAVLRVPVAQFLVLGDEDPVAPKDAAALRQLAGIIVSSGTVKDFLVGNTGVPADKVFVTEGVLVPGLQPVSYAEQLAFKDRVTEGREFFIGADAHWNREQLLLLLKAFSRFKKMQQSNWKLLLTQRGQHPKTAFKAAFEALDTYKYREDVVLFESTGAQDYSAALSAAYASVTLREERGFPAAVHEALVCNTPVLAPESPTLQGLPGLFLYTGGSEEALGKKMMELYKNEGLRNELLQQLTAHPVAVTPEPGLALLKKRLLQS